MTRYRPRWRTDAGGYVATFAGKWASDHTWADRAALEDVIRQMPNGAHIEIVEVPVGACPTCGPSATEQHPRHPDITRCVNCKEWL